MLDQNIILGPSIFRHLKNIHELLTGIAVKSDIVEHPCPAVEIPAVIMERMRPVSKLRKRSRRALTDLVLEHRLIRILPWPEITQIHTGQHLELRIGRSRADRRHLEISG